MTGYFRIIRQKRSRIKQTFSAFLKYDQNNTLLESAIPRTDDYEENDEQANLNFIGQSQKKWEL